MHHLRDVGLRALFVSSVGQGLSAPGGCPQLLSCEVHPTRLLASASTVERTGLDTTIFVMSSHNHVPLSSLLYSTERSKSQGPLSTPKREAHMQGHKRIVGPPGSVPLTHI